MHVKLGYDLLVSINAAAKSAMSLDKCSDKEYQKFTNHGKKLPNHSKHKATMKKGKFP